MTLCKMEKTLCKMEKKGLPLAHPKEQQLSCVMCQGAVITRGHEMCGQLKAMAQSSGAAQCWVGWEAEQTRLNSRP